MKQFFNSYKEAFIDKDLNNIVDFYSFPCLIRNKHHTLLFEQENLKDRISLLLKIHSVKNFDKADFKILEINNFDDDVAQVHVNWRVKDIFNQLVDDFDCIYQLEKREGRSFKIFSIINLQDCKEKCK